MISCTEFIPVYSELFKYLEKRGGKEGVEDFWNYLSENTMDEFRNYLAQYGIRGCWMYWRRTLNEEAADFSMELNEEDGEFVIDMHHCPSKGQLIKYKHITPYHDYCSHCDVIYRNVLEPMGYDYKIDMSECDKAKCSIKINKCNHEMDKGE